MKKLIKFVPYYIIILIMMWISVTCVIARFKNPKLTETEIFLNIPNSSLLKF